MLQPITNYPELQALVHVRLPVDPEPCLPNDSPVLYPYGPALDGILDDLDFGRSSQRINSVARLDDETALVGHVGLYVVKRGERARNDQPGQWIPPAELWPVRNSRPSWVPAIAMLPPDGTNVRRGIVVVLGLNRSFVHEIAYDPEGGLRIVQQLFETTIRLRSGDLSEDLDFVVTGLRGEVFIGSMEGSDEPQQYQAIDLSTEDQALAIRWTGQEDAPIALGTTGSLYLANSDLSEWRPSDNPEISEIVRVPGSDQVWAAGSNFVLLERRPSTTWQTIELQMPPRFQGCAIPGSPLEGLRSLLNIDALAAGGGFIYLTQENCNAVIAMR
ncbi:MAG: hypothetical protein AAFV29_25660, partial [Myxococcota bacterium]